jgi:hypothetical protein
MNRHQDERITLVQPLQFPREANAEEAHALRHTLNRHVPDMGDRGFTIHTVYGELAIPPGRLACRVIHREGAK